MTATLQVFFSNSHNPYFNLAFEDYLFKNLKNIPILFFYINQPSIIIGRAQNPWLECNLELMKENNILLARRQSGGGAVYHDLGNLNFSILSPLLPINYFNKDLNLNLIKKSLSDFQIPSDLISIGPRHDLWVNYKNSNYKFSGCAFRQTKDKAFHHGTLLLNTDLAALTNYLTPSLLFKNLENKDLEKIKGVKSVKSPVLNLGQINPEISNLIPDLINQIAQNFAAHWGLYFMGETGKEMENLPARERAINFHTIQDTQTYLQSYEWLYEKTLPFEIPKNKQ
jgi:lipoate-protein ligase A